MSKRYLPSCVAECWYVDDWILNVFCFFSPLQHVGVHREVIYSLSLTATPLKEQPVLTPRSSSAAKDNCISKRLTDYSFKCISIIIYEFPERTFQRQKYQFLSKLIWSTRCSPLSCTIYWKHNSTDHLVGRKNQRWLPIYQNPPCRDRTYRSDMWRGNTLEDISTLCSHKSASHHF